MIDTMGLNPLLKTPNQSIDFTNEQIAELVTCAKDPIYFIETYVKIVHVDHGLINFSPFDFQKRMLKSFMENRFTICKVGRQSGKSTIVIGYLMWYLLFNEEKNTALLANKLATAMELMGRLQRAYELLPIWMQQGVRVWNKTSFELENGSRMVAAATSASSVRGQSFSCVFLDEFAFLHPNMAEDFFRSTWPTISSGKSTKVIAVSTPYGMNHFYRMWKDAERSLNIRTKITNSEHLDKDEQDLADTGQLSEWNPVAVDWWEVPGRDEDWKHREIANFGSESRFEQEYGCQFEGSTQTLIDTRTLQNMVWSAPLHRQGEVSVWKEPEKDHLYVTTVDTSRGRGLDYSAFIVIDVTNQPWVQVCTYIDDTVQPENYHLHIARIAAWYNNALTLIEINDVGYQVATYLKHDIGYENMISTKSKGGKQEVSSGFGKNTRPGLTTSRQTKSIGCQTLKVLLETNKLVINDVRTMSELQAFSLQDNGTYEADAGNHDDLVMCLVMFAWLSTQIYFRDLTEIDIRKIIATEWQGAMGEVDEPWMPMPIIDDGQYWSSYETDSKVLSNPFGTPENPLGESNNPYKEARPGHLDIDSPWSSAEKRGKF